LSALTNLTNIPSAFLVNCSALQSVDLSGFTNVASIDNQFMFGCESLTYIKLGGVDWSNKTLIAPIYGSIPNNPTCWLYVDSRPIATTFISKVPAVSYWRVTTEAVVKPSDDITVLPPPHVPPFGKPMQGRRI
jgi:hypothetical protein